MKKRGRLARLCAGTIVLCALVSCAQSPPRPSCAETDKECLSRALAANPVRRVAFWKADRARPLGERISPAPPQLVEFITLDNIQNGYPERPRAAEPDASFTQDLRAAFAELPVEVQRLFNERLVGVYLVDKLGGTGYTDRVDDWLGRAVAGFIVLDASVLKHHTANAWATWKESTPFRRDDGQYQLRARIETGADDNRKNAIQYILLHELGHVLAIGGNIHPPWYVEPKAVTSTVPYDYFNLSWKIDAAANKYVSLYDGEFAQRRNVAYYFGAKLGGDEMVPAYANLVKTNFPSLYAATHPADDFAEAFASYVHVVMMGRPWQVTISHSGQIVKVVEACWGEARCAGKRKLLEQLLGRAG